MYVFIKLLQITLLLFTSLTLAIIPWIPSLLIENIVNFTTVGLFLASGYLVYFVVKRLYDTQKKRNVYISTGYTLLLLSYLGFFAIAQIGVSLGKSTHVKTYDFKEITLYTYATVGGGTEISTKDAQLPIRSVPIATYPYDSIVLKKVDTTVYAIGEKIDVKIYDLKNKE